MKKLNLKNVSEIRDFALATSWNKYCNLNKIVLKLNRNIEKKLMQMTNAHNQVSKTKKKMKTGNIKFN